MIEVRLFDEKEGGTTRLGEVPFDRLDAVILALRHWGLSRGDSQYVDPDSFCAQFKVDASGAYFEVSFE